MTRPEAGARARASAALVAVALAALVGFVYAPVAEHEFLAYDDVLYVTESAPVKQGLSAATVLWSFTASEAANWHPLVWLSHAADVEFFGLDAGAHHRTSVAIHALAAALLFGVLFSLTDSRRGALFGSAIGAALFALHPLRLESVAWIAERKDVLCGLFAIAALGAELRLARAPSRGRLAVVALCVAAALMSKAMAVTLPLALLLFDVWPLGRLRGGPRAVGSEVPRLDARQLLGEKLPLLALSVAASVLAVRAQSAGGALAAVESWPLSSRLANAALSYWVYLRKTLWPSDLAVFYPYPKAGMESASAVVAGVALLAVTGLALFAWRRRPEASAPAAFLFGWFWFLGTLVPVIGLVTVGEQAHADRYTYIPHLGFAVVIAVGMSASVRRGGVLRWGTAFAAALALFACVTATRVLLPHWKSDMTLFARALDETVDSRVAHLNYGNAIEGAAPRAQQIHHFERAVELGPTDANAHYHLGRALALGGEYERASQEYRLSLAIDSAQPKAWNNLGNVLLRLDDAQSAALAYRRALELDSEHATANFNLAMLQLRRGELAGVRGIALNYLLAKSHPPNHEENVEVLARALAAAGEIEGACELIVAANLASAPLLALLGGLEWQRHNEANALQAVRRAHDLEPDSDEIANDLAWMLATATSEDLRDPAEALALASRVVGALGSQRDPSVLDTLAAAQAASGNFGTALELEREAVAQAEAVAGAGRHSRLLVQLRQHEAAFAAKRPLHQVSKEQGGTRVPPSAVENPTGGDAGG